MKQCGKTQGNLYCDRPAGTKHQCHYVTRLPRRRPGATLPFNLG